METDSANSNDEILFHAIRFDDKAFEALFKENFIPLSAYCQYKFGLDLDSAKDAVHTAFIKLWEVRENISSNLSVKAYLYKTVSNICLDLIKHEKVKSRHSKLISKSLSAVDPHKEFSDSEVKQLMSDIDKAVSELPEEMRKIFELSRYEGLKYAEIASRQNISLKTVETQMSRALKKLRERLSRYFSLILLSLWWID